MVDTAYTVEKAGFRDFWALYKLHRDIFLHDSYGLIPFLITYFMPGVRKIKAVGPEGEAAGLLLGQREHTGEVWIIMIGVDAEHRRRGVGGLLLSALEDALPADEYLLTVRVSNDAAHRLYERMGYEDMRVRRDYYGGGEDGQIMIKYKGEADE
jgi:ribosomal protein S18 acetylase RimI-like enzyme